MKRERYRQLPMGSGFRLMTANLLNGRADPGHVAQILDRHQPDLLVVQEMGEDIVPVVVSRFPHHDLHPALDHEGRGIASHFEAEFGFVPLSWRGISWASVDFDSEPVVVATIHMRNPVKFPWWKSLRLRRKQLEEVFRWAEERIGEDVAFVIAGDMNASPAWPLYRRLTERWHDLVGDAARNAGTDPEATWGWRPGWPRVLRIDHVLGQGVKVTNTVVEPVRGSDHAAVVVDLELE